MSPLKQVRDQSLHALQGALVVLPLGVLTPEIGGPISAGTALFWVELSQLRRSNGFKNWKQLAFGIDRTNPWEWAVRNIWEYWHLRDRLMDIGFGTLGGWLIVKILL